MIFNNEMVWMIVSPSSCMWL